jgi:hypothetical protein
MNGIFLIQILIIVFPRVGVIILFIVLSIHMQLIDGIIIIKRCVVNALLGAVLVVSVSFGIGLIHVRLCVVEYRLRTKKRQNN